MRGGVLGDSWGIAGGSVGWRARGLVGASARGGVWILHEIRGSDQVERKRPTVWSSGGVGSGRVTRVTAGQLCVLTYTLKGTPWSCACLLVSDLQEREDVEEQSKATAAMSSAAAATAAAAASE